MDDGRCVFEECFNISDKDRVNSMQSVGVFFYQFTALVLDGCRPPDEYELLGGSSHSEFFFQDTVTPKENYWYDLRLESKNWWGGW